MKRLKLFSLFLLLLIGVGQMWAASKTVTYTVTSTSAVSTSGTAPTGSSVTFANTYTTKDQITASNTMTLTLSNFKVKVTNFTFSMHSNSSKGKGNLSYKVDNGTEIFLVGTGSSSQTGFNSWGDNTSYGTSYRDVNWNVEDFTPTSGFVVYVRCVGQNSIYCQSFTITYEESGTPQPTVCAEPTFSPAAGSYEGTQNVTITSTEGATIYYTTDGSTPSTSSSVYGGAISVSSSQTLKAYAVKEGLENSEVAEAAYTITAGPDVTLDFTSNTGWNFPTSKTLSEGSFTNGGYTIKVAGGASGTGYNFDTDHLFFGKTGAYIELPTFERPIEKIVAVGVSTGSGSVSFNLYQGETPVSTSVTSCKVDQTFEIAALNQKAGVAHFIRLTNDNNARFAKIKVYLGPEPEKYAVTLAATGGTLTATKGGGAFASGTEVIAGTVLELNATPTGTNINPSSITVSDGENDVTASVLDGTTLTVPAYAITVSATFTPTYAITKVAEGGSIELEYTAAGAPEGRAIAGTEITATATADENHTFKSLALSNNVTVSDIDENVAMFTMPAGDVTITATFEEKQDPYITLSQTEDYLFDDVAEGASTKMTFTVSGANLANNLIVAVSGDDAAKFELSTSAIEISEGGVTNYEVTVTPVTTEAGTFGATITVDDGADNAPAKSFDIAITVLPKYTAKWIVNGDTENPYSSQTAVEGTDLNVPEDPAATGNCAGLTFMGWVSEAISGSQDEAPSYVNTDGLTMPENGVTYYAVFAEQVSEGGVEGYKLSNAAPVIGDETVIIATKNGETYYAVGTDKSAHEITLSNGVISSTESMVWTLASASTGLYYKAGSNYIHLNNSNYNVTTQTNNGDITCVSNGDGSFKFKGNSNSRYLTYNNSSYGVTETESSATPVYIFKYSAASPAVYSGFVTTCSTCAKVTLSADDVANGSIAFQQDSKNVEVVKTCNAAQMVDVVATPVTGYELSGVELSGVTDANYNDGVISIPQNAEGTLVVTASFAPINYSVAMAQEGGANATISADQSDKHYGDEITVTAHAKDGYIFVGWEATPAVTFADAKALETTFSMPNSDVTVTAKYAKVLTVAEALALIPNSGDNSDGDVYVQAFVSYVNASSFDADYGTQHYYLSDNGARENELMVYYGYKGANSEKFTASNEIKAGDKVVVCGPLTNYSGTKEFKTKASYIFDLTVASHDSYEIVGELTQTAFATGDEFFDSYMANLKVNDVYNTGYKVEVAGVTFSANKTALVAEDEAVHVTATKNDATLAEKDFAITVSSATLVSFALKDGYKTEYYVGETFVKPAIIATLSDESNVEAEALSCTGYNMSAAGEYEVTVSYKYGNITLNNVKYSIKVKSIYNDAETVYDASEAKRIIEEIYASEDESTSDVYVSGIVVNDANNQGTYYISDDGTTTNQVQIYKGGSFASNSSAYNNVKKGDKVTVKGHILVWSNAAEMKATTVVYQLREGTLSIEDVEEMEVNVTADLGVEDLTINKNGSNGAISFVSGNTDALTIVDGKLRAIGNAAADVEVTATMAATENTGSINYTETEATFNVHVIAERTRYSVTFDANGGTGNAPVIANQLEGATVELPETNPYTKEGNKFMGWQVLYNEIVWEKALGESFTMPAANVTIKPKWEEVATCAISFEVNGEEVFSANAPQTDEYSLASATYPTVNGFTFLGWSETEVSDEVEEMPTIITSYTPEAGESSLTLYGIYKRVEGAGETNHYVLDYTTDVASLTLGYGSAKDVTATDGSAWVVKADKNNGMQINKGKNSSIKIPTCPNNIVSIAITGGAAKKVGFSESDYSGSGDITYVVQGTDATSQTLSFAGKTVTAGYIVPVSNANQITHIDVEYDGSKTLYTSYPVEKVTITFDANGGEGGCQNAIINKGSQLTICAEAPAKSHSEFAGWKNGDDVYVAGQAYTFDADITLTAQWDAAATYTVTYNANGATGTVPTEDDQYAGDAFEIANEGALVKSGYDFQGWKYDGKLYAAGASFTMPASAVEFVAQWKKQNISTEKMTLVTEASQLVNGSKVVIAINNEQYQYLAGQLSTTNSKYLIAENTNVTFNGNEVTYSNANVTEWTLVKAENGWQLKNGTNYLGESGDNLTIGTTNATVWTITISNGDAAITSGDYTIRYNYNNGSIPRFKTYGSTSTMALPQLYASVTAITDNAAISDLGYVKDEVIVVENGKTLTIDEPEAPTIIAKEGATVTVDNNGNTPVVAKALIVENGSTVNVKEETTVNEVFHISAKRGQGNGEKPTTSSKISGADKVHVTSPGYFDFTLAVTGATAAAQWHDFSVPFPVNALTGVYGYKDGEWKKLTNEVDYAILDFHGDFRANRKYSWKKFTGELTPGKIYSLTVNGDIETFRFMKTEADYTLESKKARYHYNEGTASNDRWGWNGLGNSKMNEVSVGGGVTHVYVLVYDENYPSGGYKAVEAGNITLMIGSAFLIQTTTNDADVVFGDPNSGENVIYYAPARSEAKTLSEVKVTLSDGRYTDNLFLSASEDATPSYEIGKDLTKMFFTTVPAVPTLYTTNYNGTKLAVENAPLNGEQVDYTLTLFAPKAGEYTLAATPIEEGTVYLTKDGRVIWNLSIADYTTELAQGSNDSYGIRIVRKAPGVATGMENVQSDNVQCTKVIIDNQVFILRGGQMYDLTGKAVK